MKNILLTTSTGQSVEFTICSLGPLTGNYLTFTINKDAFRVTIHLDAIRGVTLYLLYKVKIKIK
jgi:hypothetical protein